MLEESSTEPEEQSQDPSTEARKGLSDSSYPQAQQYTITNVSYSKFRLPLRQPLTSDASKKHREGLILRLTVEHVAIEGKGGSNEPFIVHGEVSPLPGIHSVSEV